MRAVQHDGFYDRILRITTIERLAKHSNVFLLACGAFFPTITCAVEKQHDIEQHCTY